MKLALRMALARVEQIIKESQTAPEKRDKIAAYDVSFHQKLMFKSKKGSGWLLYQISDPRIQTPKSVEFAFRYKRN